MLIKIIRNWKDDCQKHTDIDFSKRRFLGHSVQAGMTYLTLPVLTGLLKSDPALAAAACQAASGVLGNCGAICLELAGGCGLPMIFAHNEVTSMQPIDMVTGTRTLGKWAAGAASTTLIKGLTINKNDAFGKLLLDPSGTGASTTVNSGFQNKFPGLSAASLSSILSKTCGFVTAVTSNDDSNQNLLNPSPVILEFVQGSILSSIGISRSKTIYGQFGGFPTIAMPTTIASLTGAVGIGVTSLANTTYGNRIVAAANSLGSLQAQNFSKNLDAPAVIDKVNCGVQLSISAYDPNHGSQELDAYTVNAAAYAPYLHIASPATGSTGTSPVNNFGGLGTDPQIDPNSNTFSAQYASLSTYDSLARGKVAIVTKVMGGYDYHDQGNANDINSSNQKQHAMLAIDVISALVAAHVNQKRVMINLFTDGGINWNSSGTASGSIPSSQASGDRGQASMMVTIVYDPNGPLNTQHINGVNLVNQADIAGTHLVNSLPQGLAIVQALNYGALAMSASDYGKLKSKLSTIAANADVSSLLAVSGAGVVS